MAIVHEAVAEVGAEVAIMHVAQMDEILAYAIPSTPGSVISEQLQSAGRLPRKEESITWIKEAL